MNFSLTDEQLMLREAAVNALKRIDTVAGARAALDGAADPRPLADRDARPAGPGCSCPRPTAAPA